MKHNIFDQNERVVKSTDNVFGNFLVEKGLYDTIEITSNNIYELADLVGGRVKINSYCPKCKEKRVFACEPISMFQREEGKVEEYSLEEQIVSNQKWLNAPMPHFADAPEEPWQWNSLVTAKDVRVMVFRFFCAMDESHRIDFIVLTEGNTMKKIGQYPSVADLSFPELKDYRKVMSKDDDKELKRAIGLHASGIGIGSFVYLRRIFERIIDKVGKKAIEEGKISADDYAKAHVDERIKMLSEYLPKSLSNNPVFYGIVSKGIHELSEEECIEYFPVLRSFIMMVFKQWERMREDEEEEKSLSSSLNKIATKIN